MSTISNACEAYAGTYDTISTAMRRQRSEKAFANRRSQIIPIIEKFKRICHEDMEKIYPYLMMEQGRTTDFSYAGILMWVDYFNYEYAIANDTLFIKGCVEDNPDMPAFSLPIGKMPLPESIAAIRDYCRRHGLKPELSAVPEYALPEFKQLGIKNFSLLEDWGDYLYDAGALASLSGKKMSKKRNHVNKFEFLYPESETVALTKENVDLAISFMDTADSEGDSTPMAVEERRMTRKLLEFIKKGDIILKGALLKVNGKVAAFTIGDIKRDTLFVHVEKASRKYEGSYEKINRDFANMVCAGNPEILYINREDDSGDEGLRLAKQSYHPIEILRKYNIDL